MVNYQLGKIYKITSAQTTDVYVGSTCVRYLSRRLAEHRSDRSQYQKGKKGYMASYELVKYPDAVIQLIESFPCQNRDELHWRERHYIENTPNTINRATPIISAEEKTERERQKYIRNADQMKATYKDRYDNDPVYKAEKIATVNQYRINNKAAIKARRTRRCICECGASYRIDDGARHKRTKKHIQFIQQQEYEMATIFDSPVELWTGVM